MYNKDFWRCEQPFQDIYLDLGFVEAVLKTCGPVDLLNDYKKYGDQIMGKVSSGFP